MIIPITAKCLFLECCVSFCDKEPETKPSCLAAAKSISIADNLICCSLTNAEPPIKIKKITQDITKYIPKNSYKMRRHSSRGLWNSSINYFKNCEIIHKLIIYATSFGMNLFGQVLGIHKQHYSKLKYCILSNFEKCGTMITTYLQAISFSVSSTDTTE